MTTQIPLGRPIDPLHLYRHLLREASYLPGICRPFVHDRIATRFRDTRAKISELRKCEGRQQRRQQTASSPTTPDPTAPESKARAHKALNDGNRQLKGLRAANTGDSRRMLRVLQHAFGRLGKRRRELLGTITLKDAPPDSAALETRLEELDQEQNADDTDAAGSRDNASATKQKKYPIGMKPRFFDFWDTAKLGAFIHSQQERQNLTSPSAWPRNQMIGTRLDHLVRSQPETIWGTPMPERRVRRRKAWWWKSMVEKVMPPIGKAEWDMLEAAAKGELPEGMMHSSPRRTLARSLAGEKDTNALGQEGKQNHWEWSSHAWMRIARLERPKNHHFWRLMGIKPDGPYAPSQPRSVSFSERQMRRQYFRLLLATPYMSKDKGARAGKDEIVWGKDTRMTPPVATAAQASIFKGADIPTTRAKAKRGASQRTERP